MGIEYQGTLKLSDAQAHDLVERLSTHSGWKVVARADRRISFHFAGMMPGHFDEQFVVKVRPDGSIYLLFNAAEAEQEGAVKEAIAGVLQRMGLIGLHFEEG
jgi:hypothetical protein